MSHKKFGPDRFIRFNVYWIQTNKQTNKHPNRQTRQIYIQIVLLYHSRALLEECVKRDMVQIQNILYYCIFVLLYFCIIVGFYQRSVLRYMIQIQNILYYCIILLLYYCIIVMYCCIIVSLQGCVRGVYKDTWFRS